MEFSNKLKSQNAEFYRQMVRIRLFEERILVEFSRGKLFGTTHTCIGQEANAVGVLLAAQRDDIVFSNHRGHGHYLAHGGDLRALAAELMGKSTGICGGRGGSQHLHFGSFYSNGVQGGIVPCATGMALAEKKLNSGKVAVVFIGDGTLGEGVIYESFNIASLWHLPILYVVENNRYAQTTPINLAVAGSIAKRFQSFGIETRELDTTDVSKIYETAKEIFDRVRQNIQPYALILNTYRFSAHSKGDDIRDPSEIEAYRCFDPLLVHGLKLEESEREEIGFSCQEDIDRAFASAESDPWPDPETGLGKMLEDLD